MIELGESPGPLKTGMAGWRNLNGYSVLLLHHTADPEDKGVEARKLGLDDERQYLRENELAFTVKAGKGVFVGQFTPDLHVNNQLQRSRESKLWIGWDFGFHHPGIVVGQVFNNRSMWVLGELMGEDTELNDFVKRDVFPYLEENFGIEPKDMFGKDIVHACDPGGVQVSDKSHYTSIEILGHYGIYPRFRKSPVKEGVTLLRRSMMHSLGDAAGGFKINAEKCPVLTAAFEGGCAYPPPTLANPNPEHYGKDGYYEHLVDPLRYVAIHAMSITDPREPEEPVKYADPKIKMMLDQIERKKAWYTDMDEVNDF